MNRNGFLLLTTLTALALVVGCDGPINSPYPPEPKGLATHYFYYYELPKTFEPAKSYSELDYEFMTQVYEPPLEYHYLKRPYELIPLTAEALPDIQYFDHDGNRLGEDPPVDQVGRVVYEIKIKQGVRYQDHPCFAKNPDGTLYYADLTDADVRDIYQVTDFEHLGSRELLASDYVNQIYRLCDPQLECPLFSLLENYIEGMKECREAISQEIDRIRAQRRNELGDAYAQELNEREHPIIIDYLKLPFPGVKRVDDHTYQIILTKKYPQMRYWLAMTFFSPMPPEAIAFYGQGPLRKLNITLAQNPVGTGPYRFEEYIPNRHCLLVRNENYRHDPYPSQGEPGDEKRGLLVDAGKPMPLNDRVLMTYEREGVPLWNKFRLGYFDLLQLRDASNSFDQAVQITASGNELSDDMKEKGVKLEPISQATVNYIAFNMLDSVIGGDSDKQRKLRQAICIAINSEEYCSIFLPGQAEPAHAAVPPTVFGGVDPKRGEYNPYVYNWDQQRDLPVRKSIQEAKRLMTEAGYPQGIGPDGKPLRLRFISRWHRAGHKPRIPWLIKQFQQIGIQLIDETTDYNTFQDKLLNGNFQVTEWGWNADYPDAENFFFLLYGPNGKKLYTGENNANYDNPEFNRLFKQMETMSDTPQRAEIIKRMNEILWEDAPWHFFYNLSEISVAHEWVHNFKPHMLNKYQFKFRRIDLDNRRDRQKQWNKPVYWPMAIILLVLLAAVIPAVRVVVRSR